MSDVVGTSGPVAALVVAAGRGARMGGGVPKQYRDLAGRPVLARTLAAFLRHPRVDRVVVAIHPDDRALYDAAVAGLDDQRLLPPVSGGATRQASVRAGLEALGEARPFAVLVHDAARPLVSATTIDAVLAALGDNDGALPALAVTDTLKRAGPDGRVVETHPRDGLFRAQTPQGFRFAALLAAHRAAAATGAPEATDDAAVAERAGLAVAIVLGERDNFKITTERDLEAARRMLDQRNDGAERVSCTGFGYDVHALVPGEGLVLAGVPVPHTHRLSGHSDADVALHALTDALLGAIADGDIGSHFPPSEARWKDAASDRFLAHAAERVRARGGTIVNLDLTIVCERPKVGPHRDAMRERIAAIAGLDPARVSVKATTSERLGFTGRQEGIAAAAVATVLVPLSACEGR